jgi:hypothetical protein
MIGTTTQFMHTRLTARGIGLMLAAAATWAASGSLYAGEPDDQAARPADEPVAMWRFSETAEGEPFPAEVVGSVERDAVGPRPPRYLGHAADNTAAAFGGTRGYLRVADPGTNSPFDFTNGDAITLEAWVAPGEIAAGQHVYLIGKGRTGRKEVAADNQNWALRLTGLADGTVAPSFLFRSAGTADARPAFHRWTGAAGFEPDSGWHHVAVTYVLS